MFPPIFPFVCEAGYGYWHPAYYVPRLLRPNGFTLDSGVLPDEIDVELWILMNTGMLSESWDQLESGLFLVK